MRWHFRQNINTDILFFDYGKKFYSPQGGENVPQGKMGWCCSGDIAVPVDCICAVITVIIELFYKNAINGEAVNAFRHIAADNLCIVPVGIRVYEFNA